MSTLIAPINGISSAQEQKAAVIGWVRQSMQYAWPAGSDSQRPYTMRTGSKQDEDAISENSSGTWALENRSTTQWSDRAFQVLVAVPPALIKRGKFVPGQAITAAPGIGIRLLSLTNAAQQSERVLAAFFRPGELYLFDPKKGLWDLSGSQGKSWFIQHLNDNYSDLTNLHVKSVLPDVKVTWHPASELTNWNAYGDQKIRLKIINLLLNMKQYRAAVQGVADALSTGHVALGEIHGTVWAKLVLAGVLFQYPERVKSIFLEQSTNDDPSLPIKEGDRFGYFIGFNGFGNQSVLDVARQLEEQTKNVSVYAFDKKAQKGGLEVAGTSSNEMKNRNWNMAKIFVDKAGDRGGVTLNGSDHLIRHPTNTNQIEHVFDYLPYLCGIQQVFDFSGTNRQGQGNFFKPKEPQRPGN